MSRRKTTRVAVARRMTDDELIEMLGPTVIWRLFRTLNYEANIADMYVNGSDYDRRTIDKQMPTMPKGERKRLLETIKKYSLKDEDEDDDDE